MNLIGAPVQDGKGHVSVNRGCSIKMAWGEDAAALSDGSAPQVVDATWDTARSRVNAPVVYES